MSYHKEAIVKVNALVDEGIAPIVELFNEMEGIITYFSCQGDLVDEYGDEDRGYIAFEYVGYDPMTFYKRFITNLGHILKILNGDFTFELIWEHFRDSGPRAVLRLSKNAQRTFYAWLISMNEFNSWDKLCPKKRVRNGSARTHATV